MMTLEKDRFDPTGKCWDKLQRFVTRDVEAYVWRKLRRRLTTKMYDQLQNHIRESLDEEH